MSEVNKPFLISGAGIGGLAAALALARKGFEVDVLEQAEEIREIGAGIQFGPNGFRMMERLGLRDAADHLAVFPDDLILMDSAAGEEVTRIPVGEGFRKRFQYPYALIHRADLHSVLLKAAETSGMIRIHAGQCVERFEDDGTSVSIETKQGHRFDGRALIGADGLWSKIRQTIVGDGKPRVSGHIAYRAVLPIADVPEEFRKNAMILWAGPKNHLVQYPLRGGELFNLVAVFHSDRYDEGWNTEGDPEELYKRFEGTCDTVQTLLRKIQTWRMWVLCDREPVKDWSKGRVTLLGDAAHPMLQYLAQGACTAIEDAVTLADMVETSPDTAVAFHRYQNARYLRTGRCQLTARLYGEFYHATGVRRELRNLMLAGRTPEQSFESLAWLYDPIAPIRFEDSCADGCQDDHDCPTQVGRSLSTA
ncbi:3-hydroxybenzoate 6-monooxygenase [Brucella anthropi]|uniref:3-hydroxybenzoate 6-monooxygenase n=1 Tax=Brucella anthropi TaxID=529 RepID=A0A6I0D5Y9_BRUAN|nr:3-hydroxybenzoate 6-monooxygenase [Brucella anthropi]KAB2764463.1 3-hydroxybenzoate 6-monooxygenase [Brucella anthropi]KAB2778239.1 3-hydroxybenzoate 6-monooxygenase [Brucella anthropi]